MTANYEKYYRDTLLVIDEVKKTVIGKEDCISLVMAAILASGHILIDDIPGVGKTTLALAFSNAMSLENHRLQFTPDVMPADIVGYSIYDKASGSFSYQQGTVMCNLFLADEINRTSPKTQSALLEVMEENSVTVDGVTREVPDPFIVIATENPVGSVGTQLLPESQLDRFMICLSMGYPSLEDEVAIAKGKANAVSWETVEPIISAQELLDIRKEVEQIYIQDEVYEYICRLVQGTREHDLIELGVSPRGTLALVRMVRAIAFLAHREYVCPEDVDKVFEAVTCHRIILNAKARVMKVPVKEVITRMVAGVKKPTIRKR